MTGTLQARSVFDPQENLQLKTWAFFLQEYLMYLSMRVNALMLTSIMTMSRLTPCSSTLPHWHLGDVRKLPDKSVTYLKLLMLLPPGANGKQNFSTEPSPVDVETWSNCSIRFILRPYFAMSILFVFAAVVHGLFLLVCFSFLFNIFSMDVRIIEFRAFEAYNDDIHCHTFEKYWSFVTLSSPSSLCIVVGSFFAG